MINIPGYGHIDRGLFFAGKGTWIPSAVSAGVEMKPNASEYLSWL
jgi:hypothetical protein